MQLLFFMVQDYGYLDHSENVEVATGDQTGYEADTEDNTANRFPV